MNDHQRIGEAIGELRAFANELRTLPEVVLGASSIKMGTVERIRYKREMKQLGKVCGLIADRIDEIRERMEGGNR